MDPLLRWPGSKRALLPELRKRLPTSYNAYFEPFAGSAALFFDIEPRRAHLSDLNAELIETYRTLAQSPEAIHRHLSQVNNTKTCFTKWRNADRTGALKAWPKPKRAARMIYLNKACFNGIVRVNNRGHSTMCYGYRPRINLPSLETLYTYQSALAECAFSSDCFTSTLAIVKKNDFVYLDPPYEDTFDRYTIQRFSTPMHLSLLGFCKLLDQRKAKFMLSVAATPRAKALFKGFLIHAIPVVYQMNGHKRVTANELIVRNYE